MAQSPPPAVTCPSCDEPALVAVTYAYHEVVSDGPGNLPVFLHVDWSDEYALRCESCQTTLGNPDNPSADGNPCHGLTLSEALEKMGGALDAPYTATYVAEFRATNTTDRQSVVNTIQTLLYDWGNVAGTFDVRTPQSNVDQPRMVWTVEFTRDQEQDYHRSYTPDGHDGSNKAGFDQLRGEIEEAGASRFITLLSRSVVDV